MNSAFFTGNFRKQPIQAFGGQKQSATTGTEIIRNAQQARKQRQLGRKKQTSIVSVQRVFRGYSKRKQLRILYTDHVRGVLHSLQKVYNGQGTLSLKELLQAVRELVLFHDPSMQACRQALVELIQLCLKTATTNQVFSCSQHWWLLVRLTESCVRQLAWLVKYRPSDESSTMPLRLLEKLASYVMLLSQSSDASPDLAAKKTAVAMVMSAVKHHMFAVLSALVEASLSRPQTTDGLLGIAVSWTTVISRDTLLPTKLRDEAIGRLLADLVLQPAPLSLRPTGSATSLSTSRHDSFSSCAIEHPVGRTLLLIRLAGELQAPPLSLLVRAVVNSHRKNINQAPVPAPLLSPPAAAAPSSVGVGPLILLLSHRLRCAAAATDQGCPPTGADADNTDHASRLALVETISDGLETIIQRRRFRRRQVVPSPFSSALGCRRLLRGPDDPGDDVEASGGYTCSDESSATDEDEQAEMDVDLPLDDKQTHQRPNWFRRGQLHHQAILEACRHLDTVPMVDFLVELPLRDLSSSSPRAASTADSRQLESQAVEAYSSICYRLLRVGRSRRQVWQSRALYTLAASDWLVRAAWRHCCQMSCVSGLTGTPVPLLELAVRGARLGPGQTGRLLAPLSALCALLRHRLLTSGLEPGGGGGGRHNHNHAATAVAGGIGGGPFSVSELVKLSAALRDVALGIVEHRLLLRPSLHLQQMFSRSSWPPPGLFSTTDDSRAAAVAAASEAADELGQADDWQFAFETICGLLRLLYLRDSRRQFCPAGHWIVPSASSCFSPSSLGGTSPLQLTPGIMEALSEDLDDLEAAEADDDDDDDEAIEQEQEELEDGEEVLPTDSGHPHDGHDMEMLRNTEPDHVRALARRRPRAASRSLPGGRARPPPVATVVPAGRGSSCSRLSLREQRHLVVLLHMPYVVSFLDRATILSELIRLERRDDPFMLGRGIQIRIRRTHIYEDAMDNLSPHNAPDLRLPIRVNLVNFTGLDEAGIDGGGPFREFLSELLHTAFNPDATGLFLYTAVDHLLYPNPDADLLLTPQSDNPESGPSPAEVAATVYRHYHFVGRMLGKALYEGMLVEVPLAPFVLRRLVSGPSPSSAAAPSSSSAEGRVGGDVLGIHHLASLDPVLYNNLMWLLEQKEEDVSSLHLDFTVTRSRLGRPQTVPLCPGGSGRPVTNRNRREYVYALADFYINRQIETQCRALRAGLCSVVRPAWLALFNQHELQQLISGAEQEGSAAALLEVDDWRRYTTYSGGLSSDQPLIGWFWRFVEGLPRSGRQRLLKFITGCSRPPLRGLQFLQPHLCIHNGGPDPDRLPSASTCMNLLKLPAYRTEQQLRERLLYAIEAGAGFELS